MQSRFLYEKTVREHHLDTLGHVNNATVLQLLEESRWEAITANGYSMQTIRETGLSPIILEINIRYRREILLRQKIKITLENPRLDRKIISFEQRILSDRDEVMVEASFVTGLFDVHKRKLVMPTELWLHAIGLR